VSLEDELEAMRRRDDELERDLHAFQRADRLVDYTPAPDRADPFIDAATRGKAIFAAGDSVDALARVIGTDNATLLRLGDAFYRNRERGYEGTGLPLNALPMAITADALLLGVLIGRGLPR
jgi:hypothetical protein